MREGKGRTARTRADAIKLGGVVRAIIADALRDDPLFPVLAGVVSFFERGLGEGAAPNRLALETIEAMGAAAQMQGRVLRSKASEQDRSATPCPLCSQFPARPMGGDNVRAVRRVVRTAGLDEAIAFAFAKTTVLVTETSRARMCRCDLDAWARAVQEFKRDAARAWRSIGADP